MANTYTQIYLRVVFAVFGRACVIVASHRQELQKHITGIVTRKDQKLIAIYCMPDHTHVLLGLKPNIAPSDLIGDMKISNHARSTWSKCKRSAATLFILLFMPVLARAQSVGASVKTWIEIKAAHKAAEALANPNVTAKERLRLEQIYYQLVQDNPQSVPAQNALAAFLWKNGKAEAAIEHWQTAQRLQPKNGEAANSLGGAYLRMGSVREAAEQFLLAVRSESNNPDYHFDLGNVEFLFRRDLTAAWKIDSAELLQRALFQFREASRHAPTDLEYARAYAETFYGMPNPDWKEAQIAWQHYLELSTDRNFGFLQLARVSLKRHKKAEALSFLDKISDSSYSEVKEKLRKQAEAL